MWSLGNLFFLLSAVSILSIPAAERFTCTQEGFFPIKGSCHRYYECFILGDSLLIRRFNCLTGTFFDENLLKCIPETPTNPSPCVANSQEDTPTVVPQVETLRNDKNTLMPLDNLPSEDVNDTAQNIHKNQTLDFPSVVENCSAIQDNDNLEDLNITHSNCTVDLNTTNTVEIITTMTQAPIILTFCDRMNFVTTHATLVIGSPLHRQALAYEEKFNKLALMYNAFLESVKNNSLVWKNGDSIFAGIKKAVQLASKYEREFNRKYEIYKQQIPKQAIDESIISKLQEDIRNLQKDIKSSENILSKTTVPQLRLYLEENIKSKQQEIDRKQQEIASSSIAAQQLVELLHFINYVKADANEVETLVTHLQKTTRIFSSNYTIDLSTLQDIANQVNESIHSLTNEAETIGTQITGNTDRQQELELWKGYLNDEITGLNAENNENMKSIEKLRSKANKKLKKFLEKKDKVCKPEGAIKLKLTEAACNELLEAQNVRLDIRTELDQVDELLKENERKQKRSREIMEEIDHANRELTQLLDEEPRHKSKLREISSETGNLQILHRDLLALSSSANDAIDSLSVIDETLQEVNNSFEAFSKQFRILITQVESTETDEDRLQVKAAIEDEVSELLPKIHQMELPSLEMCF